MTVILNGERVELDPGTSVRQLVERVGLGKAACAAEVNKALVPRREQERVVLKDGDVVELVTMVGGG